jgi:CRP-like cAMP-binding protein
VIVSGVVGIYKETMEGRTLIDRLEPCAVFGEMGLVDGNRTATAVAEKSTTLLEFRTDPTEMFRNLDDCRGAIVLMRNFIRVLGERLRKKDELSARRVRSRVHPWHEYEFQPREALSVVEQALPPGWFHRLTARHSLKRGEYLCRAGEDSGAMYVVHTGELRALVGDPDGRERMVNEMEAPCLAGEAGFFSGRERSASLRIMRDIEYTVVSRHDFEVLEKKSPEEAFRVLHAVGQLLVHLILQKESL